MSNPYRAEIEVELGGEKRTLIFDYNALCELEELYDGKSVTAIFGFGDQKRLAEAMGPSLVRRALYVGLKQRRDGRGIKGLTLEKVGDFMSHEPKKLGSLMGAITNGILLAMFGPGGPTPADEAEAQKLVEEFNAENPTKAATDGTGNG